MFKLPILNYEYNALEPYIDARTMEVHYTKHHNAYVTNLNAELDKCPEIGYTDIALLLKNIHMYPKNSQEIIKNNAGGYVNHNLYFKILKPGENKEKLDKDFEDDINDIFGTVQNMKEQLKDRALKVFGSGWAWLVFHANKELKIISTPNQDSPLMGDYKPIIGIDVWEHAYYLKHQNRRAEYIDAFFQALNLEEVSKVYNEIVQ